MATLGGQDLRTGMYHLLYHAKELNLKVIGCSNLKGGGGELGTIKTLTNGSN